MDDLLEQRRQTHGDFADVALVAQATKDIWRAGAGWKSLTPVQREGLEMIASKVARILCGNPNYLDHYIDIAGYAQRIIEGGPQPARLVERKPSVESLRWFGAYQRTSWEVGRKHRREAYATARGGRYQVERYDDGFAVRYRPPYDLSDVWDDIGTTTTEQEAIAVAEAHNRH